MAEGTKLSVLPALTGSAVVDADMIYIVVDATKVSYRISRAELHAALVSGYFASQAQAEAGTDDTKVMNPLRTKQAIAALTSGGLAFISTADLSNVATVSFTGFNAAIYDSYLFVLMNVIPASDGVTLNIRTSTDGGSNYDSGASDYGVATFQTDSADVGLDAGAITSAILTASVVGSAAGEDGVSGDIGIHGPHLAKETRITFLLSYEDASNNYNAMFGSGTRRSAADVDAVQFFFSSGNLESGTITMWGRINS